MPARVENVIVELMVVISCLYDGLGRVEIGIVYIYIYTYIYMCVCVIALFLAAGLPLCMKEYLQLVLVANRFPVK